MSPCHDVARWLALALDGVVVFAAASNGRPRRGRGGRRHRPARRAGADPDGLRHRWRRLAAVLLAPAGQRGRACRRGRRCGGFHLGLDLLVAVLACLLAASWGTRSSVGVESVPTNVE
jgi:hypothetical protein